MTDAAVNMRSEDIFYSSLVTEHIVPLQQEIAFIAWHQGLEQSAKCYPGFLRLDLCEPLYCPEPVVKWYSILHFDSPTHLQNWIESSDRQGLLELGQSIVYAYRFKSFTTGLEGWFSQCFSPVEHRSLAPPAWKQIFAVVLGLYPVVMLQSQLFAKLGWGQGWPDAIVMLLNNVITSSILSLLIMPAIARKFRFWLHPPYRRVSKMNDAMGVAIIITCLVMMMALFTQFM